MSDCDNSKIIPSDVHDDEQEGLNKDPAKEQTEEQLDETLDDTFPASDPIGNY